MAVTETRTKTIGGTTYRVAMLPAKVGRNLLVRIVKQLGPGIAGALSGVSASGAQDNLAAMVLGASEAIHVLCARLQPDEFDAILDVFAKYTTLVLPDNVEPQLVDKFDTHFAGRYDEMLSWAAFCMEVNFASFFGGSSGGTGTLVQRALTLLQSTFQKGSTGTSGASPAAPGSA
jgi:hypothetical protein